MDSLKNYAESSRNKIFSYIGDSLEDGYELIWKK